MKKLFLTIGLVFSAMMFCNAQGGKIQFSVGPELGFTTGDFGNTHSFGIGGNIIGEFRFEPEITGTIASGIQAYSGKKIPGTNFKYQSQTMIPIRGGVRYYLGQAFYGAGEIGVGVLTGAVERTALSYSIGVGSKIKAGSRSLDLGAKYDANSFNGGTLGAIVFRVNFVL
jgi:hypothetical protein